MKNHLVEITKYNLWANQKIVDLLNAHPKELMFQKIEIPFSRVNQICSAAQLWNIFGQQSKFG